jgi:hypothetical protein
MGLLSRIYEIKAVPTQSDTGSLLAVIDFSYHHYALGDLLTTEIDLAVMATELKLQHVDILVMVDPARPSTRYQSFITPANYITYLDNIMPVFSCVPMFRSLQLVRDVPTFNFLLVSNYQGCRQVWPDIETHLKMRHDYPLGHQRINTFYANHGYIPQLAAPRGCEGWARRFHQQELGGRPLAIINPRQSSLTSNPAAVYRDAPLNNWNTAIDEIAARYPEVLFTMVGGYQEWEHRLLHRRNVFIPRACGLGLPQELALMKTAHLFMGTSSGFGTFATFTDIPYVILNVESSFAQHAGIKPHDRHYPFGRANQTLTWEPESTEQLIALFETLYASRKTCDALSTGTPAARVAIDTSDEGQV